MKNILIISIGLVFAFSTQTFAGSYMAQSNSGYVSMYREGERLHASVMLMGSSHQELMDAVFRLPSKKDPDDGIRFLHLEDYYHSDRFRIEAFSRSIVTFSFATTTSNNKGFVDSNGWKCLYSGTGRYQLLGYPSSDNSFVIPGPVFSKAFASLSTRRFELTPEQNGYIEFIPYHYEYSDGRGRSADVLWQVAICGYNMKIK